MLLSQLAQAPTDWPAQLASSPLWKLHIDALQGTTHPLTAGWLVLFGHDLAASQLRQLAPLLALEGVQACLYPVTRIAGVPLLLIGTDSFSSALAAAIKQESWAVDICHLAHLPSLAEPGLLVMDMDSTAIQMECIDEIARLAGVGEQVSAVTAAAMQGQLEFADSLRARVALLAGAPVTILDEVAADMPWMPGLQLMVDTLKQSGWTLAIASGGFTRFAGELQQALGLDAIFANELAVADGKLTGQVAGEIVDADAKARVLTRLAAERGLAQAQTVAVGDGANDLKMMAAAGLGIAIHAKPLVRAQASASLTHHDLEGVICLLGARACAQRRWHR
ncbi:phosphoserine phosphatase SerB [Aeromonas sobria]|uniref:phosphoserine phosphatase SerB n=1 Tax=Aeromonas sobria TaxID=646 RepID=UPI003D0116BF